jgi:hypothetical protein
MRKNVRDALIGGLLGFLIFMPGGLMDRMRAMRARREGG